MRKYWLFLFIAFCQFTFSQKIMQGQVIDYDNTIPVAFAKIAYENKITYTDWEGRFSIEIKDEKKPIVFSYKGYYNKTYYLTKDAHFLQIKMVTDNTNQDHEVFSENQVNLIIKKVIESKSKNRPEKALATYQYKNYEYTLVSANPDSITSKIDTIIKHRLLFGKKIKLDSSNYRFKKYVEKQHIYQTEKVNLIQHNSLGTKETILASRMAGFKKPVYEYLGLNMVSYDLYENRLEILEIPVQNPISKYGRNLFVFKLIDTLKIQGRTVYQIYFQPKKLNFNHLRGLLYIDTESNAIAKAFFRIYGIVNINASYTYKYLENHKIWFPEKRNINVVKGNNTEDLKILGGTIKFNSILSDRIKKDASDQVYLKIESTPYDIEINKPVAFKDKFVKIYVPETSLTKPDSYWKKIAKDTIDVRKISTYTSLDSISEAENIEHKLFLGRKIINGYFPVSFFDIDLRSIIKFNNFEGWRVGFGGVTNNKLSDKYKIGFFGAYGLKDKEFKFGISPSYLIDKETSTWINASYLDDISEIGKIQFVTQSKRFKIYDPRPINISTFYNNKIYLASIESKFFPKIESFFSVSRSRIQPLFDYTYTTNDIIYKNFNLSSLQFAFQWSPASKYMQTSSGKIEIEKRYPKVTFQYTKSFANVLDSDFNFSKIDFLIYQNIPYLSGHSTSLTVEGGISNGDIPLTHLYSISPNNVDKASVLKRITFAGKNSFETMYYNEFFSSKYVAGQVKHTFNKVKIAYKIKPQFAVVTRFAIGNMNNKEKHEGLEFKTLEKGFLESGVEANQIYKGLGLVFFYRYGPNALPHFEDNLAIKLSFILDLGI